MVTGRDSHHIIIARGPSLTAARTVDLDESSRLTETKNRPGLQRYCANFPYVNSHF